jgi:ABC-type transport system substrate-binding protein
MMIPAPASANGPRTQYLRLQYYADQTVLYLALKAGAIDVMGWPLTRAQYEDAITDPDIIVCPTTENGMFELDLNNNWTLPDGKPNPLRVLSFRQAVARCVDKINIITNICGGHALRLDTPLTSNPNYGYWWKSAVAYPYYPYEFNITEAEALLDEDGFSYAHPGDTVRTWDVTGQPLEPLKFYIRTDHQPRRDYGRALRDILVSIGVPCGLYEGPSSYTYTPVMGDRDYHIYTGGWSIGVNPTVLYNIYHEKGWYPYGANYVTGMNALNEPNYPDLDYWLEKLYYANDVDEALQAALMSQNLMITHCIDIWCYAAKGYYAYRNLLGVVNYKAYGTYTGYTFLNAYTVNGAGTIVFGLKAPPTAINVITASWVWDWQHLDRLYDTLTGKSPYDLGATGDQPSIAQDWKIELWVDPEDGATKTKLTFYLRCDAKCCDGTNFTAYDVEWCLWYHYACGWDDWNFDMVMDVKKTNVIDEKTIEIYLNVKSMWALYWMNFALFQRHIWDIPPLVEGPFVDEFHYETIVDEWHVIDPILPGDVSVVPNMAAEPRIVVQKDGVPLIEDVDYQVFPDTDLIVWLIPLDPCQIITFIYYEDSHIIPVMGVLPGAVILKDGIPLIPGVDYRVEGIDTTGNGDFCYNRIVWLIPLDPCQIITITYWTVGDYTGFFPGGLPAATILIGSSMYKYVSHDPLVYMLLERADHYYLNVPLGEIDWRYYTITGQSWWLRTTPPPKNDGYYTINIYDVVLVAGAYGSQGMAIPSANWFAGADLAAHYYPATPTVPHCGLINIYDVVTVTGKYSLKWGSPPPNPPPPFLIHAKS